MSDSLTISITGSPDFVDAMAAVAAFASARVPSDRLDGVRRIAERLLDDPKLLFDIRTVQCDGGAASGASKLAVRFEPGEGLRDLLAAFRALDVDGNAVEDLGHGRPASRFGLNAAMGDLGGGDVKESATDEGEAA
jgi:hypothetical protein